MNGSAAGKSGGAAMFREIISEDNMLIMAGTSEGSQVVTFCHGLKLAAPEGKCGLERQTIQIRFLTE